MHVARMEKLATFLEGYDGPIESDLGCWTITRSKRCGFLWLRQTNEIYKACAIGLAITHDLFEEEGLGALRMSDGNLSPFNYELGEAIGAGDFLGITPMEFSEFFTIRGYNDLQDDAEWELSQPTYKQVADKIRAAIAYDRKSKMAALMGDGGTVLEIVRKQLSGELPEEVII